MTKKLASGPTNRHKEAMGLVKKQTGLLITAIAGFLDSLKPQTFADNLAAAIKEVFQKLKFELHFEIPEDSTEPANSPAPAPTVVYVDPNTQEVIKKSNDFDTGIALLIGEQNGVLRNINENFNAIKNLIQTLPTGQKGHTFLVSRTGEQPTPAGRYE